MNYTPNHHLPQWSESDRVRMEDFNRMSRDIETGLDNASALPYAIGSYTGSSAAHQTIQLDFTPSFLIISGMQMSYDANDITPFDRYFAIVGYPGSILGGQLQYRVQIANKEFIVYQQGNHDSQLPSLNEPGRKYYYIAFR